MSERSQSEKYQDQGSFQIQNGTDFSGGSGNDKEFLPLDTLPI